MKRLFIIIGICVLLVSGCNTISIEDRETVIEEQAVEPVSIDVVGNEEENVTVKEMIEGFFLFDWLDLKEIDARPVQYLALGDSLTRGIGDEKSDLGFTGILARELEKWPAVSEVILDNRGKNGRRSDQLLTLLENGHYDAELESVDLLTMTLGGNDVMKVVKRDIFNLNKKIFITEMPRFIERYQEIIKLIRAKTDAPLVMIGFYDPFKVITEEIDPLETSQPFDSIITEWNDAIEELANRTTNACFVSVEDLYTSNLNMVYHTDFFHPNAKGYGKMAERVIERMKECDVEQMSGGLLGFEE